MLIAKYMIFRNKMDIMDEEYSKNNESSENTKNEKTDLKQNFWKNFVAEHPISVSISCSIIASIIISSISSVISLHEIESDINTLVSDVSIMKESINNLTSDVSSIKEENINIKSKLEILNNQYSSFENRLQKVESNIFDVLKIQASSKTSAVVFNQFSSIQDESFAIDLLFTSKTDIAGVDILTHKE